MNKRRATAVCEVVELVLQQHPDVDPPGIDDRVDREDLELGLKSLRFVAEHGSDVTRHKRKKAAART